MVGGFFLLRFVNPAIVTPHAYMLVDAQLSNNARRNLTLVCLLSPSPSLGRVPICSPLLLLACENHAKLGQQRAIWWRQIGLHGPAQRNARS